MKPTGQQKKAANSAEPFPYINWEVKRTLGIAPFHSTGIRMIIISDLLCFSHKEKPSERNSSNGFSI